MHELFSGIIKKEEAQRIATYFPHDYQVHFIYKATIHGFKPQNFKEKVFNAGPTLILARDVKDTLFGGFTTKNWTGEGDYVDDPNAFVFNL